MIHRRRSSALGIPSVALSARLVMYDELIENALEAYQDYVDSADEAGRVYNLIMSIRPEDFISMSPPSS